MDSRRAVAAATMLVIACGCSSAASDGGAAPKAAAVTTSSSAPPTSTTTSTSTTSTTTTTVVRRATTTTLGAHVAAPPATAAPAQGTVPKCAGLANQLARTGDARQLITVQSAGWGTSYAQVELWEKTGSCWVSVAGPWSARIGANGFRDDKIEGDNATPTGMYGVGTVMYGNAADPGVHETYLRLRCGDWWDEDPSSNEYNTFQAVPCNQSPPFGGGSEPLWKETKAYPSFAVVDYNTAPVTRYKGSAIFFHADIGSATAGCVSVPLTELDYALDWLQPSLHPAFVMGPVQEITGF